MIRAGSAQRALALAITAMLFSFLPFLAHAQSATSSAPASGSLSATIRAELLSDPRTSSLTQSQLNALVQILTENAQAQGITSQDIERRIQTSQSQAQTATAVDICAGVPGISCKFDLAFGFLGAGTLIPYLLGAASMGLIWILAEMIHRKRHPQLYTQAQPSASPPPPPTPPADAAPMA